MEKRKNKILVGCLALLLVMAVGYALFSETITINGTATAKGDFDYEITTYNGITSELNSSELYSLYLDQGIASDIYPIYASVSSDVESSITNTKNTITYSANLKYPTQKKYFTAKLTNTGSIPITIDLWENFIQNTTLSGNLIMPDGELVDVKSIENMVSGGENPYGFTVLDKMHLSFMVTAGLEDAYVLKKTYDEAMNAPSDDYFPKLQPGESMYLTFIVRWRESDLDKKIKGADIIATEKLTIPISQTVVK